jgi:alkyl sulfatase BDS1-like metallo-beta-lactamase superfamily hydrolase
VGHSARAIYQRYLGWYDANPAHLDLMPQVERARRYVEYMGGENAIIARARADYAKGEYRFVAEVISHVVFANPSNAEARALGADALEQLGYSAESATYRNAYLTGAQELRLGSPRGTGPGPINADLARAMSPALLFDYLAVRLDPDRADQVSMIINWVFSDLGRSYRMNLSNCALTTRANRQDEAADATVTLERSVLDRLTLRELKFVEAAERGLVAIAGDVSKVEQLFELLDVSWPMFEIVEPKAQSAPP